MKLIEISRECIEKVPFEIDLTKELIIHNRVLSEGNQLVCLIPQILGIDLSSFLIYITYYGVINNIPVATAVATVDSNQDKIYYQIYFSEKDWKILKIFLDK